MGKLMLRRFMRLCQTWNGAQGCQGTTLADVMIGTLITSLAVGGTMSAFVTAARLQRVEDAPLLIEASGYAQDFLEPLRNHVAADDFFFPTKAALTAASATGWLDDDVTTAIPPATAETAKRVYRVVGADCNGNGIAAGVGVPPEVDCYAVAVKVCWNQPTCP